MRHHDAPVAETIVLSSRRPTPRLEPREVEAVAAIRARSRRESNRHPPPSQRTARRHHRVWPALRWLGLALLAVALAPAWRDDSGMTEISDSTRALAREVERGDAFGVRFELARGGDPDHQDAQGVGLLHRAAQADAAAVIEALVAGGARVDLQDAAGDTPLHYAVAAEHVAAIDALVAAGADPNHANQAGQRPVDIGSLRARRHLLPDVFDITGENPAIRR